MVNVAGPVAVGWTVAVCQRRDTAGPPVDVEEPEVAPSAGVADQRRPTTSDAPRNRASTAGPVDRTHLNDTAQR